MPPQDEPDDDHASRVRLSYPSDLPRHARDRITQEYYRQWLRRTRDAVAVGDEWAEFTDVGCCGSETDVPLRVEAVEGGARVGPETTIEYTERDACGVDAGWAVQNEGTPR